MLEVEGKLIQVMDPQTGQGKNGPWRKQQFVIETPGEYPRQICLVIWGDKINLEQFQVGEPIKAGIDIASREYNGRWYTDVKAWKVERAGADTGSGPIDRPAPESFTDLPPEEQDDLPF